MREIAFLPITESICGLEVVPMTLAHYAALRVINSPFLMGGTATPEDAFSFLWYLWVNYSPKNPKAKRKFCKACRCFIPIESPTLFKKRRAKQNAKRFLRFLEVQEAIKKYVLETMQDRPPSSEEQGKSYFSYAAAICHDFATEYGWPENLILTIPLKRLFQYCKIIAAQKRTKAGMRAIYFNPSDEIQGKLLIEANN